MCVYLSSEFKKLKERIVNKKEIKKNNFENRFIRIYRLYTHTVIMSSTSSSKDAVQNSVPTATEMSGTPPTPGFMKTPGKCHWQRFFFLLFLKCKLI